MPTKQAGNQVLRRALTAARLRDEQVAEALGVDPKTVQRWISGRVPHARHRWGLADLLGRSEHDLWPDAANGLAAIAPEVHATYPHRGAVPREVWRQLFNGAEHEIGILVYSGLFIVEDVDLVRLLKEKAQAGARVRIALGNPDSEHVTQRGLDEGIADAMAAKIRNAIVVYQRMLKSVPNVELRLHSTALYNSLYRADNDLLINQHVYGVPAAFAPVLHLRGPEDGDLMTTYLDSFERIWSSAKALHAG